MPRLIFTLTVLTLATSIFPRDALAQRAPVVTPLYASYAAGEYARLREVFTGADAFRTSREEIFNAMRDWRAAWKPSQAAFLLELSFVAYERGWDDAADLLGGARDFVVNRPSPPTRNPAEDAFEMTFHRAAVAFLTGRQLLDHADAYLTALAGRIDSEPSTAGKPRIVDPWMIMARAVISDLRTAPAHRPGGRSPDAPPSFTIGPSEQRLRQYAESAVAGYTQAQRFGAFAPEAAARRGFLLHRLGRQPEALEALAQADAARGEPVVVYWTRLFRGRVLEASDQHETAAAAYEEAFAIIPGSQTPAVALASLWQRHDRPSEALRWALVARSAQGRAFDPWWQYWSGEYRLWTTRLAELRQGRP